MPAEKIIQLFPEKGPQEPAPHTRPARSAKPTYGHSTQKKRKHFRYTDAHGVSREHTVYGDTVAEAERNKQAFLADVAASVRVDEKGKTVATWADEWLVKYKSKVGASTRAGYLNDLKHLKKALGNRPLRSIYPSDLKAFIDTRAGLSSSAIRKTAMTTRALFQAAMDDRLIPFNPASGLKGPKGTTGTHRALSDNEQRIVEKVAQTHRFGFAVMLMLWGGLRMQEVAAFDPDTCVEGDELSITHAVEWISNRPHIKPPKSEAGIRHAPIFPKLKPFIEANRGKGYAAQLANGSKSIITKSAFERGFESFCTACDEELNGCSKRWQPKDHIWITMGLRTHDFRHSWFTMLYDTGVDVKVAAAWGGHGDLMVTQRIYQHIRLARKRKEMLKAIRNLSARGDNFGDKKKRYRLKR